MVVDGAGYIISHILKMILAGGYEVVTFDKLFSGHINAVLGGEFILGDLAKRVRHTAFRYRQTSYTLLFACGN